MQRVQRLIGHPSIFYLRQLCIEIIAFKRVQHFDNTYQYPLFVAAPYEIITFEISSTEIDKSTPKFFSDWDPDSKMFMVCFKGQSHQGQTNICLSLQLVERQIQLLL
ncbi:hypothetical protein SLEP1_g44977 [Rubroshorea leprosula]|uniref:SF3A2 domain-containing protein n=1 Tax=Rubroshorea leprosula TaxID=152421 RepID=A0AAV5LHQ5_9ROSI|nr:hypothetical protein SLEP1_g44977 [Rubroshorea leprosula]